MTNEQQRVVHVNGAQENLAAATVSELLAGHLARRELDLRGIAVALNGRVIPRAAWNTTALKDGDAIEIVRAMRGG
jgi:sulfur carrier protein